VASVKSSPGRLPHTVARRRRRFYNFKWYGISAWLHIGTLLPKNTKAAAPPKRNNQASRRRSLKEGNRMLSENSNPDNCFYEFRQYCRSGFQD
jgi:hypothetical protein